MRGARYPSHKIHALKIVLHPTYGITDVKIMPINASE